MCANLAIWKNSNNSLFQSSHSCLSRITHLNFESSAAFLASFGLTKHWGTDNIAVILRISLEQLFSQLAINILASWGSRGNSAMMAPNWNKKAFTALKTEGVTNWKRYGPLRNIEGFSPLLGCRRHLERQGSWEVLVPSLRSQVLEGPWSRNVPVIKDSKFCH